ncbi:MAG: metallophosphoesterase [Pseudomonadota bacterium]
MRTPRPSSAWPSLAGPAVLVLATVLACDEPAVEALADRGALADAGHNDAGSLDAHTSDHASGDAPPTQDAALAVDRWIADVMAGDPGSARPDAGAPDLATVADSGSGFDAGHQLPAPLVLLHLSDIHFGSGSFAVPAFELATDEIIPTVAPLVTFASGDLVEVGNNAEAWDDYMAHLDASGLDDQNFIEVPGNHDIYLDLDLSEYLAHTLAGRAGHGTHGLYSLSSAWGRLRVLALDTVSSGDPLRDSTGYLAPAQVDELIAVMATETEPAAITVALGHHPIDIDGLSLFNTDDDLLRVLDAAGADAYLFGHRHIHMLSWRGSCLFSMARTLGNPGDANAASRAGFNILVYDDGLTARGVPLDEANMAVPWPVVMITRPANPALGSGNPWAQPLPRASGEQLLRAMVFAPGVTPEPLRYRVDDGAWQTMRRVDRHYEARFETPDAAQCQLEVEAATAGVLARDILHIDLQ